MKSFKEYAKQRGFFQVNEAAAGGSKKEDGTDGALTMDAKDFPVEECMPEIAKIHQCFQSPNLKNYFYELQKPTPDEKYFHTGDTEHHRGVARSLTTYPAEKRKEFKFEKRKLYVVGAAVRNWLYQKMHMSHKMDPLKPCAWSDSHKDWNLATDAHPDEVWMILHAGVKEGLLPKETNISYGKKDEGMIKVVIPSIRNPKKKTTIEISPFRVNTNKEGDEQQTPPRFLAKMGDDYKGRDVTYNALYYDLDAKKVYDPTKMGIGDLAQRQARMVGEKDPAKGIKVAKNHSDILGGPKKKPANKS
jgi:hypothetical protein